MVIIIFDIIQNIASHWESLRIRWTRKIVKLNSLQMDLLKKNSAGSNAAVYFRNSNGSLGGENL